MVTRFSVMKRPVQHTAAAVAEWLREGRRVVAGLLVEVEGSSPLDVGASMYVDDRGGVEGSLPGRLRGGAAWRAPSRGAAGGAGWPPRPWRSWRTAARRSSSPTASRTSWPARSG